MRVFISRPLFILLRFYPTKRLALSGICTDIADSNWRIFGAFLGLVATFFRTTARILSVKQGAGEHELTRYQYQLLAAPFAQGSQDAFSGVQRHLPAACRGIQNSIFRLLYWRRGKQTSSRLMSALRRRRIDPTADVSRAPYRCECDCGLLGGIAVFRFSPSAGSGTH